MFKKLPDDILEIKMNMVQSQLIKDILWKYCSHTQRHPPTQNIHAHKISQKTQSDTKTLIFSLIYIQTHTHYKISISSLVYNCKCSHAHTFTVSTSNIMMICFDSTHSNFAIQKHVCHWAVNNIIFCTEINS